MSLPPDVLRKTLREASHLARLLGDMVHEFMQQWELVT